MAWGQVEAADETPAAWAKVYASGSGTECGRLSWNNVSMRNVARDPDGHVEGRSTLHLLQGFQWR
jgi:hypothetical protein